jgi:hypothetical protein
MADGYFPTLVSKDKDPNAVADPIWVQLTDGTTALSVTGTSLDVNLTNSSVPVTGTFWQTTQPISGSVTVSNAGGGSAVNIQDGGNTITVDGSVGITGSVTVTATSLDIRPLTLATDAVKISANSTANGVSNPIYVALGSGPITGEVHSYDATSVTTTGNHDYTVTTAMLVKSVSCSCSGGGKFELQTGPVGTLVSKWTGFVPKAGGTVNMTFDPPIEVPVTSTGTVRIIRTNRESQAQSMYTTIVGIDA